MKYIFTLILFALSLTGNARTFYLAPTGNDNNTGTISSPWFTLNKAWTAIAAGDTVYMRGGTYTYTQHPYLDGKNGTAANKIYIFGYPGERPIVTRGSNYTWEPNFHRSGVYFEGNYFHWKNIRFTGFFQPQGNGNVHSAFMAYHSSNNIFEWLEFDNSGAGFSMEGSSNNNLLLNCDGHDNKDPYTSYGNADGIQLTWVASGTTNTIRNCRSWNNSDDGIDVFNNLGYVIIENCWSYHNGFIPGTNNQAGNGNGYKFGYSTNDNEIRRILRNCIATGNRLTGFDIQEATCRLQLDNCVAYNNNSNGTGQCYGYHTNYQSRAHIIRNSVSFGNEEDQVSLNNQTISTTCSNNDGTGGWTNNVSNADFQSTDATQIIRPRKADGSLPDITFLNLAAASDLINSGTNIGLPFNGSAPDRGAFESGGVAPPPVNQPPVANAGTNKNITLPTNSITQTGSGTDPDGTIAAYQWTKLTGPAQFTIVSPTLAQTVINTLLQGVYQFELRVTDNLGAIGRDTMTVTVNPVAVNQPPVANAGTNKNITLPTNSITQTGSGTDPDGTIAAYQWTKITGPAQFTIVSPTLAQTVINTLLQGVYQFELRVTDNLGAIGRDTMTVTVNPVAVNQPPVANAGTNKNITLPTNSITQTGSGTDPDGTIAAYQWTKIAGPAQFTIVSPTQGQTVINNLVQGVYQFELSVTDNLGAIGRDTMTVTVNPAPVNQPPVANAGTNKNITLPTNSITQTGSGTDPDGTIAAYQWTKIAGPAQFTIVSPTQGQTVINNLVQGVYQFELSVTDNLGAIGRDTMTVTVNPAPVNQPPVANAGTNKNITLPTNSITQTGSGTDPDGTIAAYQWTKITGPAQFTIVSPTLAQTVINNLVQGVYQFELRVTDNLGAIGRDTMTVTVNPAPVNQPPVANAGTNKNITLPTNSITQTGSGTDPDGTIAAYQWTKIAGPAQFTIVSPTLAQTVINNLVQGVYQFELRVTDNLGAIGRDTMTVTVNPAASTNQLPVADAGPDQTITIPVNSIALTGSGTDPDGTIAAYQWTKIAGPVQYTIVSPTLPQTEFINLQVGTYLFELTVTDNLGAAAKDTVTVEVIETASLISQGYPNPVNDKINIRINPPKTLSALLKIKLYDSRGIVILEQQLSTSQNTPFIKQVDMTKYPNGFYLIEVTADNKKETLKIIKQ